jgi:hypothetical protein
MSATDRRTARRLMRKMGVEGTWLRGPVRARSSSQRFPSMKSLSNPADYFARAMETELEHGGINPRTDVTHDGRLCTAKIVAAHLFGVEANEAPDHWRAFPAYYDWLWFMEDHGRALDAK